MGRTTVAWLRTFLCSGRLTCCVLHGRAAYPARYGSTMASASTAVSAPFEYANGSIKSVTVSNFLLYHGTVKVTFGPRVNLIVGPNGNGKSSIVAAIMLGLGGTPKMIGRQENIGGFIRRRDVGETEPIKEATILVEMNGRKTDGVTHPIFILRVIQPGKDEASKGTSVFFLSKYGFSNREQFKSIKRGRTVEFERDGIKETIALKYVNNTTIDRLVKARNIELGNYCQFLPQDVVGRFALLSPAELLKKTQQAVLGKESVEIQNELIALEKNEGQAEKEIEALEHRHTSLDGQVQELRERWDRMKDFKEDKAKLNLAKKKIIVQDFVESRDEYMQAKTDWKPKKARQLQLEKEKEQVTKALKISKRKMDKCLDNVKEIASKTNGLKKEAGRLSDRVDHKVEDFFGKKDVLEDLQKEEGEQAAKIEKAEARVAAIEAQYDDAKADVNEEHLTGLMKENKRKIKGLKREADERKLKMDELREQGKGERFKLRQKSDELARVRNVSQQKLEAIFRNDYSGNVKKAYFLIKNMKRDKKFRGRVWGPIANEIECQGRPDVVEKVLTPGLLNTFVFSSREDEALFQRENPGVYRGIAAVVISNLKDKPRHFDAPYGMRWLDELVISPSREIMSVIYVQSRASYTLVGGREVQGRIDRNEPVFEDLFRLSGHKSIKFYTDSFEHSIRVNPDFPGSKVEASEPFQMYPKYNLGLRVDAKKEAQIIEECKALEHSCRVRDEACLALQQENVPLNDEIQRLSKEIADSQGKLQGLRNLARKIESYHEQIEHYRRRDIAKEIQDHRRAMGQVADESREYMEKYVMHYQSKLLPNLEEESAAKLDAAGLRDEYQSSHRTFKEHEAALRDAEREEGFAFARVNELRKIVRAKKANADAAQKEIEETCGPDACKTVPDTVAALEALINMLETKLSEAEDYDPNLEAEYTQKAEELRTLSNELKACRENRNEARKTFEDRKATWKDKVQRIVTKMSTIFHDNFQKIPGCYGILEFDMKPNLKDYGLRMMVSYRENEGAEPLSFGGHSGGEKKMATAMFLLALQKMSHCPLRIVDEINQGVDVHNERIAFGALVETVCGRTQTSTAGGGDASQFFVVTPKLLPNLNYRPEITVLICFKATHMLNSKQFSWQRFIEKKQELSRKRRRLR